ncbi:helix-turn-helix domain-containing protein [Alicyclobacillus fastidiosus]|uniref:Helix-turn-helix transcriptional regulator n=1 Tax=Alicyclobacillus fastidiosus TaxID=392011 RepID=A0ABV5AKV8_9BACL|nr:helix-turn-helix transcriptional regulator [Alicyclobacillus fastidiosus]WEH10241.1 helix-turn-helix transcriptional regulator [Alicyclobacillus fastidiosus]
MTIGEKIRDIRIKRGLTQSDLGGDLVTPSMISQIEADRAKPSYPLLMELANRLGMPVEYFMNEMDDQFLFNAKLTIAMYQSAVGDAEDALEQLESVQAAPEQGLTHQEYILTLAQTYRKLGRYHEATSRLEHLREVAYRTQDQRLLFYVCKESGYVEAGLSNVDGAVHEWSRAIEMGQVLLQSDLMTNMDLIVLMTEVMLQLHETTAAHPDRFPHAPNYLQEARALTAGTPDLRAVCDKLVEEALACIATDPARSKVLADKANTMFTFSRLVEHIVVVQTRLVDSGDNDVADPWQQAALAMTSIYPDMFLKTECEQLEKLLRSGKIDAAEARAKQARNVLLALSAHHSEHDLLDITLRLDVIDAQLTVIHGNREAGIAQLKRLVDDYPAAASAEHLTRACALLVLWYGEIGETASVLHYCRRMEQLMVTDPADTPLFI